MNATLEKPAVVTPPPGVYEDVPFAVYRGWKAVNNGSLSDIQDNSPLHCLHRLHNPEPDTEALRIGRAFHTLTLEGEASYIQDYPITSACVATVKSSGRRCENAGSVLSPDGFWYCGVKGHAPAGSTAPVNILTTDQDDAVHGMAAGLRKCKGARDFLEAPGPNELSILWVDKETGLLCKARIDMARPSWNCIGDLKTTENASRRGFVRSIEKYGYHRQGAFYLRAAAAARLECQHFGILPVEKGEPHAAGAYRLSEDSIAAGEEQIARLMRIRAKCEETGIWPGYSETFQEIGISEWEMKRIADGEDL